MLQLSTELVELYLSRGFKFTRFYSPQDTEMFMRMAREVADEVKSGTILDIGTGSAIPLIHAIGKSHYGIGIDKDEEFTTIALENTKLAETNKLCFIKSDFKHIYGWSDIVMSNPPYIPSETVRNDALDVKGDGTEFIRLIFQQFHSSTNHFVIHFSSISNPLRILRIAKEFDFLVTKIDLGATRFGSYTAEEYRLAYLVQCRNKNDSIFHTISLLDKLINVQLLITCHFIRKNIAQNVVPIKKIKKILNHFQSFGLDGLRNEEDNGFIRIGSYPDYPVI